MVLCPLQKLEKLRERYFELHFMLLVPSGWWKDPVCAESQTAIYNVTTSVGRRVAADGDIERQRASERRRLQQTRWNLWYIHFLTRTDVTVQGRVVRKSPYIPLGMETHYRCSPRDENHYRCFVTVSPVVSNDNTLALTHSTDSLPGLMCRDQHWGNPWEALLPLVFPSVVPSTLGRKSLYLRASLVCCYRNFYRAVTLYIHGTGGKNKMPFFVAATLQKIMTLQWSPIGIKTL